MVKNNERLNKTIVRSKPLLVVPKTDIFVEMAGPNKASFVAVLLSGGETPDFAIRKKTRGSIKLSRVISAAQAHQEIQRGFGFHEFETFQAHSLLPPELVRRILHLPSAPAGPSASSASEIGRAHV